MPWEDSTIAKEDMDETTCSEDLCLDLSVKEFWLIVHYPGCDVGSEFELIHGSQLVGDSWDTLERGANVELKFGNAKVQANVVMVSDEYNYLQHNLKSITEEFLMFTNKPQRRYHERIEYQKKPYIKVKDKGMQTDPDAVYESLKESKDALQAKYDNLLKIFDQFKGNVRNAINKADSFHDVNVKDDDNMIVKQEREPLQPLKKGLNVRGIGADVQTDQDEKMVYIGTHKTAVPKEMFESVNWLSYSAATRKLLISVFPRKMLATHSLTGKPSPAFIGADKQTKMRLDPVKISDIVEVVSRRCHVSESIVRSAITTKCADENKMYRKRMEKRQGVDENEPEIKRIRN